jgi:hypothetical protein
LIDVTTRRVAVGIACGITTFLLSGAVTISVLGGKYGESPGVGILGVATGLVAGLIAAVVVGAIVDRSRGAVATALVWYGSFGTAFLVIAGARYVNVPGADELFTFQIQLLVSALAAAVVAGIDHRSRQ